MIRIIMILVIGLSALWPASAYAHRLNLFAVVKDGEVRVESYYSGGARCKGCRVEVFNAESGMKVKDGLTDETGIFSFKIVRASSLYHQKSETLGGSLRIVVNDRMGHRDEYLLKNEDVPDDLKREGGQDAP